MAVISQLLEIPQKIEQCPAMNPLYKAKYKISLFENEVINPSHLNIYFPGKKTISMVEM
ncbi:MAG: hypothetical protein IPO48_20440 [Saprospiraceae bacterium]|nr:hypothetical protein [Saprospiraceae bacterium]